MAATWWPNSGPADPDRARRRQVVTGFGCDHDIVCRLQLTSAVLKIRGSYLIAVGELPYLSEAGWRFSMRFSRYTLGMRWLDFSFQHDLPLRVGPIILVDSHQLLSLTNCVTVSIAWVEKYFSSNETRIALTD